MVCLRSSNDFVGANFHRGFFPLKNTRSEISSELDGAGLAAESYSSQRL